MGSCNNYGFLPQPSTSLHAAMNVCTACDSYSQAVGFFAQACFSVKTQEDHKLGQKLIGCTTDLIVIGMERNISAYTIAWIPQTSKRLFCECPG